MERIQTLASAGAFQEAQQRDGVNHVEHALILGYRRYVRSIFIWSRSLSEERRGGGEESRKAADGGKYPLRLAVMIERQKWRNLALPKG
jgi:hypothetical protein